MPALGINLGRGTGNWERAVAVALVVRTGYAPGVTRRNFGSADYEPTDEDLAELMHEAFAGVREANDRALAALREQVRVEAAAVLARLHDQDGKPGR